MPGSISGRIFLRSTEPCVWPKNMPWPVNMQRRTLPWMRRKSFCLRSRRRWRRRSWLLRNAFTRSLVHTLAFSSGRTLMSSPTRWRKPNGMSARAVSSRVTSCSMKLICCCLLRKRRRRKVPLRNRTRTTCSHRGYWKKAPRAGKLKPNLSHCRRIHWMPSTRSSWLLVPHRKRFGWVPGSCSPSRVGMWMPSEYVRKRSIPARSSAALPRRCHWLSKSSRRSTCAAPRRWRNSNVRNSYSTPLQWISLIRPLRR